MAKRTTVYREATKNIKRYVGHSEYEKINDVMYYLYITNGEESFDDSFFETLEDAEAYAIATKKYNSNYEGETVYIEQVRWNEDDEQYDFINSEVIGRIEL